MKKTIEKISYLKGLSDGLQLDTQDKRDDILMKIIDIIGDITVALEDYNFKQEIIFDILDELDEDLLEVEEYLFNEDDMFGKFDDLNFDSYEAAGSPKDIESHYIKASSTKKGMHDE